MKLAIDIVKSILLPKLEKDTNFDIKKTDATFWESFSTALLDFDKGDTTCKTAIYNLDLINPEKIISKLPNIYNLFINELAENYVLGNESEAIDSLLKSNNKLFQEEVRFLSNLEEAITEIEHERIKAELPNAYASLVAELNEKDIKETKVISFKWFSEVAASSKPSRSWIKYAAAACIVLTVGIATFTNQTGDNNVVTAPAKEETRTPEIPSEAFAEVAIVTKNTPVIESGLGFASKKNNIKIVENNQKARMASIITAIENYRKLLEKEFANNRIGYSPNIKRLEFNMDRLRKQLELLKDSEKHYVFDGKELVLFVSNSTNVNTIVLYEATYYLKKDADYFKLTVAEQPQLYKKESNKEVVSALDKIIFDNGN